PTTGEGGHGHHTASAILAEEAFDAAADPAKFPEQLKQGVSVWQAKRLLWNTFSFGGTNTQREDQFKLECGDYNPILGKSYGEIAAASRSQHKSQGFGVPAQRGSVIEYFKTIRGTAPAASLMDDVETGWRKAVDKEQAAANTTAVEELMRSFNVEHPETILKGLVTFYTRVEQVQDVYWREQKKAEIEKILENCSGLFMDATTGTQYAVAGDSLKISLVVNNRSGANILSADAFINHEYLIFDQLKKNVNTVKNYSMYIQPGTPLTQPYWLENAMDKGSFNVTDQQLIGKGESDPMSVVFSVMIEGKEFKFTKPIRYKHTDPVKGELYQPVTIIPKLELSYNGDVFLSVNNKPVDVKTHIRMNLPDTATYSILKKTSTGISAANNPYIYKANPQKREAGESSLFSYRGKDSSYVEDIKLQASRSGDQY
ncbi:MAG TPA: PIG-L family deacetylase, partial [Ferruginibacter sp.]|nr:PIG-L family deacetylase [Ferruginibacter sp.]